MKNKIMQIILVLVLAVIAFGYVSVPILNVPASDPNAPAVMGKKILYLNNEAIASIDVEDSNDDTLTVMAQGGTVLKRGSIYVGDTTITDANGTQVLKVYKTTYDIKFKPTETGYQYPQIVVTDSHGVKDIQYIELDVRKKNIAPVITGCRMN